MHNKTFFSLRDKRLKLRRRKYYSFSDRGDLPRLQRLTCLVEGTKSEQQDNVSSPLKVKEKKQRGCKGSVKIELLKIAARLKRMIANTEILVAFSCVLIELKRIFFY